MSDLPVDPVSSAHRKPLVMVTGVQRSGTTAVFGELSRSSGVSPRHESADDPIYHHYFLRPEPQIRGLLHALPGTVLLKPVRETSRRSLLAIADEYADYDLRMIWLYRDPVNVFASWVARGWTTATSERVVEFADHWCVRNEGTLAAAATLGERLVIVNYEDLCSDPAMLPRLAALVGLSSQGSLRRDGRGGRRTFDPTTQASLDAITGPVTHALADARSLRPTRTVASRITAIASRWLAAATTRDRGEPDAPGSTAAEVPSALVREEYTEVLRASDPAPFYRQWHVSARPPGWLGGPECAVAVGYEVSRDLLAGPTSRWWKPRAAHDQDHHHDDRLAGLEELFAESRAGWNDPVRAIVRRHIQSHVCHRGFMLSECLATIVRDVNAEWMGCPAPLLAKVCEGMTSSSVSEANPRLPDDAAAVLIDMPSTALLPRLLDRGVLAATEVPAFLGDTARRTYLLCTVVPNALLVAARHPPLLDRLREAPETIPRFLVEAVRLAPSFVAVKKRVPEAMREAGLDLPAGTIVDVFIGAANRDPAVFADPDRCLLDRTGPPPIMLEAATANALRLRDDAPWPSGSLLFDTAAIVLEALIAGDRPFRIVTNTPMRLVPTADGNCRTLPAEMVVALDE